MKQYCRYCTHAHYCDVVFCDEKGITMSESSAKAVNNCKHFSLNEIDVFYCGDMNKKYKPREPKQKECNGQINLNIEMEEVSNGKGNV